MSGLLTLIAGKDPLELPGDGHSLYVCAHARAAIRAGYEPEIVCVGRTASVVETDFGLLRRIATPVRPARQLMIPALGPLLARDIVSRARAVDGPVLVHGFGVWSWAAVRACERLRAEGRQAIPVLSSYTVYLTEAHSQLRGLPPGAPLRTRLESRLKVLWVRAVAERYERIGYRGAERVFVNYDSVRRMIHERHGPGVRVEKLPYSPESDFLPAAAPPPPEVVGTLAPAKAPLVLSLSSHHARKGADVLIEALALARDRGTPLRACMLSSGPLFEHNRKRVHELGLDGSVALTGRVDDTQPYLQAANIYALPSREEQSGALALLEAMRAGLPPIASAVDGILEDVEHEESALLVAPGDPAALADALVRLASDEALRERIATGARRRFEERFAADRFAEALGAAYAELGFESARPRSAVSV